MELLYLIFSTIFIQPVPNEQNIDTYHKEIVNHLDGDLDSCLQVINKSIIDSKKIDYPFGEAYGNYLKAYIHRVQNDKGKAFVANLKALTLLQGLQSDRAIDTKVRLHIDLGHILHNHFKYVEAIQYFDEGLAIANANNLERWIIDLQYNKGLALKNKGDLEEAIAVLSDAYHRAMQSGDEFTELNSLNLIGLAYNDNGDFEKSRSYFELILEHNFQQLNKEKYIGRALHNIANSYLEEEEVIIAESYFQKALERKRVRNKAKEVFITLINTADVYLLLDKLDQAKMLSLEAKDKYEKLSLNPKNYKLYELLGKIAYKENDIDRYALNTNLYIQENEKFLAQQQELIQVRDQFKMELLSASYFNQLERDRQIALLKKVALYVCSFLILYWISRRIYDYWNRKMLERELKEAMEDINIDVS